MYLTTLCTYLHTRYLPTYLHVSLSPNFPRPNPTFSPLRPLRTEPTKSPLVARNRTYFVTGMLRKRVFREVGPSLCTYIIYLSGLVGGLCTYSWGNKRREEERGKTL
ncbi:hypothetical protein DM02DRAFT_315776 [Periconia macrospinosa]|uniref:Uncharacterized protein n=1 Tax=Periconia macrospinosa TaxID=97972 RepID=A0A2V1D1C0_9PLEO|nr:hypothetical protein DM02DRAFT_315776 [Periconia macrospinosa]